jgi:hypothetical protein
MKKTFGFIVTALIFIAILVYVFITKGFSGMGTGTSTSKMATTSSESNLLNTSSSPEPTQETGTVASDKISLVVTSPADGETLSSTNVTIKGKTTPNADVFVNDQSGKADANGNFAIGVTLDEGSNQIVVSANDSVGNATDQDLNVTVSSFQ